MAGVPDACECVVGYDEAADAHIWCPEDPAYIVTNPRDGHEYKLCCGHCAELQMITDMNARKITS
jgi:hypothetical protein